MPHCKGLRFWCEFNLTQVVLQCNFGWRHHSVNMLIPVNNHSTSAQYSIPMWLICGILFTLNILNLENKKLRKNPKCDAIWKWLHDSTWWIMNRSNFTPKWLQKVRKALWLSLSKIFWLARNYWKTLAGIKSPSGIGLTKHLPQNITYKLL